MFAKMSYTWELMGASWAVLKRDKTLVLFPLISSICCILVVASFIVPWVTILGAPGLPQTPAEKALDYTLAFAFYFCNYFVITFFNVGLTACAIALLNGGKPSFVGGLREALKRVHLIAGWALLSATVGVLLKALERQGKIGRFIVSLLGTAWSLMIFLVVPVLVVEGMGPIEALKRSTGLLKKTWGEQLAGNFAFGVIFFLFHLAGVAVFIIGAIALGYTGARILILPLFMLLIVYWIVMALVQSVLHTIFQSAVYLYTIGMLQDPTPTCAGFPVKLIKNAVT